MAKIVQAQYDRLESLADRFGRESEQVDQMTGKIRQAMESLRLGGWIGQGADAFLAEMEGEVLPVAQRLAAALNEARAVTLQVRGILQEAEEEAGAPFKGGSGRGTAVPGGAGPGVGLPGGAGPGGAGPSGTGPSPTPAPGGSSTGGGEDSSFDPIKIGLRLLGLGTGTKGLINLIKTGKAVAGPLHAVPIAGGIVGTILGITEANARGENMDFAVGREITKGTFKTEVYLVPGVNLVAGAFELAHFFGITDTNFTDRAVEFVSEPVHKYALDPTSDFIADRLFDVDQGVRSAVNTVQSSIVDIIDAVK